MHGSPVAHEHVPEQSADARHFTLRTYLIGFAVAALLTAIPFWIVMTRAIASTAATTAVIVTLAIAQIFVQTSAFLHVNARAEGGWKLVAYVFTAVLVAITISGSLWIMYHLNSNMMPGMGADSMSQMP